MESTMAPRILFAPALALLLASPLAVSQDAPTAPSAAQAHILPAPAPDHGPMRHRMHRMHMERGRHSGAMSDLHALERLYLKAGRQKDLAAVYNEVLSKSQDPRLRTYAYHRLARLQAQPANVDQAIATLRKSLSENLANEAKMRAERERMRAQWQQSTAPAAR
jgi:predicted negative regulator of RcsB-dependent stress response